jgi:hypothetical protein
MENQHRKISGYRELSQTEIDLMNKIKYLGPQLEDLTNEIKVHLAEQLRTAHETGGDAEVERIAQAEPFRWLAIGRTDLQTGLMALTRAVAQPNNY